MFEIRLTIEKEHADQMLQAFIASVPQFDVKVMQQENSSVLMQLTTAKRPSNTGFRGGRPKKLTPDQQYRLFPNRRFNYIDLALTGRCNFSCKHCFNAADCNPRSSEPSLEEILRLIGRLDECGVGKLRLNAARRRWQAY